MPHDLAFRSRGLLLLPREEAGISRSSCLHRFVTWMAVGSGQDQARCHPYCAVMPTQTKGMKVG